jgi:MFS transporter, DHA1 family, multidrug resistance protein
MSSEDRRLSAAEEDASEHFHRDQTEASPISRTPSRPRSSSKPHCDQDKQSIYRVETKDIQQTSTKRTPDWYEGTLESRVPSINGSTGESPSSGTDMTLPRQLPDLEDYIVEFDGPDDPTHPQNWPSNKKVWTAAFLGFAALSSSFGSSVFSACVSVVAEEFGVSSEVTILGISLYVSASSTQHTFP